MAEIRRGGGGGWPWWPAAWSGGGAAGSGGEGRRWLGHAGARDSALYRGAGRKSPERARPGVRRRRAVLPRPLADGPRAGRAAGQRVGSGPRAGSNPVG
jgi:hypothetical protein